MVWLFPGGGVEKALTAPPPPSHPKLFDGLTKYMHVCDFPIDFPTLLSNRSRRDTIDPKQKNTKRKKLDDASTPWATSCFHTLTHVRLNRVDKETDTVKCASLFYVCPVGVGRIRFLSSGIFPLKVPRWVFTIIVSNFLDQDIYLLATQQKKLLVKEADNLCHMMKEQGINAKDMENVKKLWPYT
eukprot:12981281-Ditylum_brightwellii.AAC.1